MIPPGRPTPGPWAIGRTWTGLASYIHAARRRIVNWHGLTKPSTPEGEANARLLAAAPMLLAACKLSLRALQDLDAEADPVVIQIVAHAIAQAEDP